MIIQIGKYPQVKKEKEIKGKIMITNRAFQANKNNGVCDIAKEDKHENTRKYNKPINVVWSCSDDNNQER